MKFNLKYLLLPLSIMVCTSGNYINAMEVEKEEEINTNNITQNNNQQNNIVSRERIQKVINSLHEEQLEDYNIDYYGELLSILEDNTNDHIELS